MKQGPPRLAPLGLPFLCACLLCICAGIFTSPEPAGAETVSFTDGCYQCVSSSTVDPLFHCTNAGQLETGYLTCAQHTQGSGLGSYTWCVTSGEQCLNIVVIGGGGSGGGAGSGGSGCSYQPGGFCPAACQSCSGGGGGGGLVTGTEPEEEAQ